MNGGGVIAYASLEEKDVTGPSHMIAAARMIEYEARLII
jgi:hypothetical protein